MSVECYLVIDFFYWGKDKVSKHHVAALERKIIFPSPPYNGLKLHLTKNITDGKSYQSAIIWANGHNAVASDQVPIVSGDFELSNISVVVDAGSDSGYYHAGTDYVYESYDSATQHAFQLLSAFGFTDSDDHSIAKKKLQGVQEGFI